MLKTKFVLKKKAPVAPVAKVEFLEDPALTEGMDPEVWDIRTEDEAKEVLALCRTLPPEHVFGIDVEWERPKGYDKKKEGHLRARVFSWQLSAGDTGPAKLKKVFFRNWGPHAGHSLRVFKEWLKDPNVLKTGHNLRSDRHVMLKHGIRFEGFDSDGQDLDWLYDEQLRENRHGLKECSEDHLGYDGEYVQEFAEWFAYLPPRKILKSGKLGKEKKQKVKIENLSEIINCKPGERYPEGGIARIANYSVKDPYLSTQLREFYKEKLSAISWAKDWSLWDYYERFERPYWTTLWNCEHRGLPINTDFLLELNDVVSKEIDQTEFAWYSAVGKTVDDNEFVKDIGIGSNKDLHSLFIEKLGLKSVKNTKPSASHPNGQPSFDDGALELMVGKYPEYKDLLEPIQEYRSLSKIKSSYILSFVELVEKSWDGYLHTNLRRTLTTGRLASSGPNLQNLPDPAKGTDNFGIRDSIEAPEGWVLICGDLSQIEMRLLAHFSRDEALLECFNSVPEKDTHCAAARWLFPELKDLSDEEIKKNHKFERSIAKIINFGLAYGMTEHKLSRDMNKSVEEALIILKRYFQKYRGVYKWIEGTKRSVNEVEHVRTYLRRYCRFQGIRSAPFKVQKAMERSAVNAVIQGSAADLIQLAMLLIDNTVPNPIGEELAKLNYRLIMQVHDELLGMCPTENRERCVELIREAMSNPYKYHNLAPLRCATPADVHYGKTWYEAK